MNVFELMMEYVSQGRVTIDRDRFRGRLATVHDPCNYGRKSQKAFGQAFYGELRHLVDKICTDWVDTYPTAENNFCCGAGGGAWAMPYSEERIYYGRKKAEQILATGAEMVVAPCHNCRDQIMKSLNKEYSLDVETFYLWELLAEAIVIEPWGPEKVAEARGEAELQWERLGVEPEEEEEEEA